MWTVSRAVARFFVTVRALSRVPNAGALLGGLGLSSPTKFSNWEAPKCYFQHLSWDMSPKNRPRIWIGKQLQVTIIKITESKENKSIQRLDVSGSTCPRGDGGAAAPLASTALGSGTTKRDSFFVSPSLPVAHICGNCRKDCQWRNGLL